MPDFLFIGAPRSGSTWLHKNFMLHPDLFVPPCKSILYFHPRFQIYRLKKLKYFGRDMLKHSDPEVKAWYRRFFFTPFPNNKWYSSLFSQGQLSGEIAEAYCSLDQKDIERIQTLNSKMKIIFIMRNPYERALSHAKLGVIKRKGKTADTVSAEDLLRHIDHPSSEARSFYTEILRKWESLFPPDQLFIRFYEDIQNDADLFLKELYAFLDVPVQPNVIKDSINVSGVDNSDIPDAVKLHTAKKYYEEVCQLADRFGGHAIKWKENLGDLVRS